MKNERKEPTPTPPPKNIPAFPVIGGHAQSFGPYGEGDTVTAGMSLRDYFAAKAMQGISANTECNERTFEEIAEISYKQADAMLKAREDVKE